VEISKLIPNYLKDDRFKIFEEQKIEDDD